MKLSLSLCFIETCDRRPTSRRMNDEFLPEPESCTSLLCNYSLETLSSLKDEECNDYLSLQPEPGADPFYSSGSSSEPPASAFSFWNDTEPSTTAAQELSYPSAHSAQNSYCSLLLSAPSLPPSAFATASYPSYQPQQRHCNYYVNRDYSNRYLPAGSTFAFMPTSSSHVRMEPGGNGAQMMKPCDSESFKLIEKLRPKNSRTKYSRSQVSAPICVPPLPNSVVLHLKPGVCQDPGARGHLLAEPLPGPDHNRRHKPTARRHSQGENPRKPAKTTTLTF